MADSIRSAAVAGSWYPADARGVGRVVEEHLARVHQAPPEGRLVGLVAPHAGLQYSGSVAAHAYALLRGRRNLTVILVGPSHRVDFEGCALWARGAFDTPLGRIPVDEECAAAVLDPAAGVFDEPRPHRPEHSLEMQLPFLQHLVAGLKIVPVLMGRQTRGQAEALAAVLARAVEQHPALLVASSDLSHFQPAHVAQQLDREVVGDVERLDPEGLMTRLERDPGHACGGGPLVAVLSAARRLGADHAVVLRYGDSGDEGEHDKSRVVGYLAAALLAAA